MRRYVFLILVLLVMIIPNERAGAQVPTVIHFHWTATGIGIENSPSSFYDGRYAHTVDSLVANWDSCAVWPTPAVPAPPSQPDSAIITVPLEYGESYYFAIRIANQNRYWSDMSNVVEFLWPDTVAPAPILDLRVGG